MNEQHFDALPPLNLDQSPASAAPNQGGEAKASQSEVSGDRSTEQLPGGLNVPSASSPLPSLPADDAAAAASTDNAQQDTTQTPIVPPPAIADDVDLIEKEWVEKAKHIVEQTKHDPYQQNQEMTKMKADYLKKRYNRDLKVGKS